MMENLIYEFAVCNKFFSDKEAYLRYLRTHIPGIISVSIYMDDQTNILWVRSSARIEVEVFRILKEHGIAISFFSPPQIEEPLIIEK